SADEETQMAKGNKGESCAEAVTSSLKQGEVVHFAELLRRVKNLGSWTDETILQHLMSMLVNLPPARLHWPNTVPSLFLHEDGRYELFDYRAHGPIYDKWDKPLG